MFAVVGWVDLSKAVTWGGENKRRTHQATQRAMSTKTMGFLRQRYALSNTANPCQSSIAWATPRSHRALSRVHPCYSSDVSASSLSLQKALIYAYNGFYELHFPSSDVANISLRIGNMQVLPPQRHSDGIAELCQSDLVMS